MEALMKIFLSSIFFLMSAQALAQDKLGPFKWDYAYVNLNKRCDRYYSLYPPDVKCMSDHMYGIQYKIEYIFNGNPREAFVRYIPSENSLIDHDGNIVPPDETIKGRY
jgi:hypothetical protein